MIDLDDSIIRPLALNSLAYPSGLALSVDEKNLYVCETCKNRVLRFVLTSQGNTNFVNKNKYVLFYLFIYLLNSGF